MLSPIIETSRRGVLHRAPPRVKLLGALVLILITVMLPRRPDPLYFAPAGVLLLLWPLSRLPWRYALRRMLIAECFILGIGVLTLFAPAAAPVFFSAFIKSNLCVFTMLLLTWTTPFHEILQELRRVHFPSIMLTILALMWRYLPVMAEESGRMQRARASRTFSRGRRIAWRNFGEVVAQLFIRSANRAERIYLAMCARGWK
ncbi:MAG TPA: cobalt ECF transporter T component CbiQ [Clostridia bacterium]|nr:cobalt ECF transporter T component CbiQ [Clostridia bacterium]